MLNLKKDSVVVDCTLGSGGHAREIISHLGNKGIYVGVDVDPSALSANDSLQDHTKAKVILVKDNFRNIKDIVEKLMLPKPNAILADLGWRIEQFEGEAGEKRGFSFNREEPLSMTFGKSSDYPFTAYDIVNDWAEEDIANVIYAYGEERYSRRIARSIVEKRQKSAIKTSTELALIVKDALPRAALRKKIHPATKTFQALRVAVNDEFDALKELLYGGLQTLAPKGRLAIISFHSLEDRIVKETFRTFARDQKAVLVHKKPFAPGEQELTENPRARSAKLRTIEKI